MSIGQFHAGGYDGGFGRVRTRSISLFSPPSRVPGMGMGAMGLYYPAVQQTLVVDGALPGGPNAPQEPKTRRRETIFGPDVGDDDQPGWAAPEDGNKVSVDVVKRWVERAKAEEGLHATTTLQALVNLKRPTLLLQPLEQNGPIAEADVTSVHDAPAAPHHILKFSYDAMTPLVQVTLSIHPEPVLGSAESLVPEPRVLYTGTHPGGFNQSFTLSREAALDLTPAIAPIPPPAPVEEDDKSLKPGEAAHSDESPRSSTDRAQQNGSTLEDIPELPNATVHPEERPQGRRFGLFPRRHREPDVEEGPNAIEMTQSNVSGITNGAPAEEEAPKEETPKEPEHGMRLLIRLEAVGPEAQALRRRNAQLTHMLISGTWVPDAGSTAHSGTGKRVWVVKVVRREAVIGAHSFLLKEIYGLSSSAATDTAYPPAANDPYASTPNECIVCLTSPRDVVLLPCRHLVVCRDCAVGMVEFGAGGRVARREDEGAEAAAPEATEAPGGLGGLGVGADMPPIPAPAPPRPARRKKKAKGWYCPVCRQPYTSLLRLALPPSKVPGSPELSAATPARAASIRSVRTTRSTRTNGEPTLPSGAEAMLAGLAPAHVHAHNHEEEGVFESDEEEEEDESTRREREQAEANALEAQKPQFVVAESQGDLPVVEDGFERISLTDAPTTPAQAHTAAEPAPLSPAQVPSSPTAAGAPVMALPADKA